MLSLEWTVIFPMPLKYDWILCNILKFAGLLAAAMLLFLEQKGLIDQPVLVLALFSIITQKEPSPSVKPVIKRGE